MTYLIDILEELKATVICLCSRDYVAALQLKTSQQILNTVCTAAGQFMIVTNFDKCKDLRWVTVVAHINWMERVGCPVLGIEGFHVKGVAMLVVLHML